MLKTFVLLICIGIVIWFVTVGRVQLTEENVRALYEQSEAAFERADGKAYCELFTDNVSGKITSRSPKLPISNATGTIDKNFVCNEVATFKHGHEQISAQIRSSLNVKRSYEIKSISISPDKKSATAEVLIDARYRADVGEIMILKVKQTDQIKINDGKIRIFQREAVWTTSVGADGNPAYR